MPSNPAPNVSSSGYLIYSSLRFCSLTPVSHRHPQTSTDKPWPCFADLSERLFQTVAVNLAICFRCNLKLGLLDLRAPLEKRGHPFQRPNRNIPLQKLSQVGDSLAPPPAQTSMDTPLASFGCAKHGKLTHK